MTETDLLACGDCPLLILACDGVWDVFSDQEAADLLLEEYLKLGEPFQHAAELLVCRSFPVTVLLADLVVRRFTQQSRGAVRIMSLRWWCFCE